MLPLESGIDPVPLLAPVTTIPITRPDAAVPKLHDENVKLVPAVELE